MDGQNRRWRRVRGATVAAVVIATTVGATGLPVGAMAPTEEWTETLDHSNLHFGGAAGADGSVIVAGQSAVGSSDSEGFVRRIDAAGTESWRSAINTSGTFDSASGVAATSDGSSYVVGITSGDLEGSNAGSNDVFVRAFTASGATRWTDQFGSSENDSGRAIAVGSDGSVYVAGDSGGDIAAGGGGGILDGFVRKYSSAGAVVWTIEFGGADTDVVTDIAVADDGTVWVVGHSAPSGSGFTDGFVTRIDSGGSVLSTDTITDSFPSTSFSKVHTVAAHPSGGVVVGGEAPTSTTAVGFLRRYAADGDETWSNDVTGDGVIAVYDLDVGDDGTIYVLGFPSDGTFEEGAVSAFGSDGAFEWSVDINSSNSAFVVETSDGALVAHGGGVLSTPGRLTRFAVSGSTDPGFTDVPEGAFYAEAVEWLKDEGITTGTSATTFSPDDTVTRGQMAAFLHRLAGEPGGSPDPGFADVAAGKFYEDAVAWLKAAAITTGTSATTYSPDDAVTRGQMAAFLWRLAGEPGGSSAHGFTDVSASAFYADAVAWLKAQGITTGTSASTYSPDAVVTRGQMAAFLFRMATDSDWDYPGQP